MSHEEEYAVKKEYRQFVPIEGLVAAQINRLMDYGTKKNIGNYEEGVDRLIDLLAPEQEETALAFKKKHNIVYDLSPSGKELYVLLFRYIKKLLAEENIVWKRSSGYQVGHD